MEKTRLIEGQCEWCGTDYQLEAILDGENPILCPTCGMQSENWDTVIGSTMSPMAIIINDKPSRALREAAMLDE